MVDRNKGEVLMEERGDKRDKRDKDGHSFYLLNMEPNLVLLTSHHFSCL